MSAVHAQTTLSVAQDVRRLIGKAEQGHAFDFEMTGHAYDVMSAASEALASRIHSTTLAQDIARRIEHFAQSKGSAQMYMRLVITDTAPDLPEYDPSEVIIFDGVNGGANFSTADLRLTNFGTVMTSVNITDLKAYFEAGRKRILVAYMGTDRNADAKANDKLLSLLPGLLASMGMDTGSVKNVIEAVKAGHMPAPVSKLLHQIAEIAQTKALVQAQPGNQEAQAKLAMLEKDTATLVSRILNMPQLPVVFIKAFETMMPSRIASITLPAAQAAPISNDNTLSAPSVRALIHELRAAAKDKSLPPAQRREIAEILRDLRAGIRDAGPTPQRIGDGLRKLDALAARVTAQPHYPAIYDRILPRSLAVLLPPSLNIPYSGQVSAREAVRDLIQTIRQSAKDRTLPPVQRQEIAVILRDLRAGVRSVNPAPLRLGDGLHKLSALTTRALMQPQHPILYDRILPAAVATALRLSASPFLAAMKPMFAAVLRDAPVSPPIRTALLHANESGKASETLARYIVRSPGNLHSIAAPSVTRALHSVKASDFTPLAVKTAAIMPVPGPASSVAPKTIQASAAPSPALVQARVSYGNVIALPQISSPPRTIQLAPGTLRSVPSVQSQMQVQAPISAASKMVQAPAPQADLKPAVSAPDKIVQPVAEIPTKATIASAPVKGGIKPPEAINPVTIAVPVAADITVAPSRAPEAKAQPASPAEPLKAATQRQEADASLADRSKALLPHVTVLKETFATTKLDQAANTQTQKPSEASPFMAIANSKRIGSVGQAKDGTGMHETIQAAPMRDIKGQAIAVNETVQQNWSNDTLNLLKTPPPSETKVTHKFQHVCGEGCNHGTVFKATDASTETTGKIVSNRNMDVTFVAVEPKPNQQPTSKRPQRTMKPA